MSESARTIIFGNHNSYCVCLRVNLAHILSPEWPTADTELNSAHNVRKKMNSNNKRVSVCLCVS